MDTLMEIARVFGPALTSLLGAYVAIKYRLARVEESLTDLKSNVKELTEKHTELVSDISDMKVQNAEDHGEVKQQLATLHTQMKIVLK